MIEINSLGGSTVWDEFLKKIARTVLTREKSKLTLSVALVSSRRIKELNRKYRRKNRPTDVLSFQYGKEGEIVICLPEVRKNVKKFGPTFKKELKRVLIHGVLHLLGYDHEGSRVRAEKMREKENYYFKLCQRII
ncbi:MAG: rRNA maturation RNase YbeY [Candidatus Paceibacterota bacterium]